MKKSWKILISVILALCASLGSIACKSNTPEESDPNESDYNVERVTYEGTHVLTAPDTNKDFVKDGATEYKIVMVEGYASDAVLKNAKDEFVYFFKQATGITMQVLSDEDVSYSDANKYISIGDTSLFRSSGIELDKKALTEEGVRIVTKGNTIYLNGGSNYGVLFAVYDFLQIYFNFDNYYTDCWDIDEGVTDLKLKHFDVTDIPDIPFRSANYSSEYYYSYGSARDYDSLNAGNRMRMPRRYGNLLMPIHTYTDETIPDGKNHSSTSDNPRSSIHNSNYYLPRAQYQKDHPNWFGSQGVQLCYTAHGNEQDLEEMIRLCAEKIEYSLKRYTPEDYPNYNIVTLTVEDGGRECQCDSCIAAAKKYKAESAPVILFVNRVNKLVREWLAENENAAYRRDNFHIVFFAYNAYVGAPVITDENSGEFVATAPEIMCDEGVGVFTAYSSGSYRYYEPFYSELNVEGRDQMKKWALLSDFVMAWTYSTNFRLFMYPCDTFSFYYGGAFSYFAANNVQVLYNQAQISESRSHTAFHLLKAYLDSKLEWDSSLDVEQLIEKFFNAMYREAAPIMKRMWTEQRLQMQKVRVENLNSEPTNNIYTNLALADAQYFPFPLVSSWIDLCGDAVKAVSKYKTQNPSLYDALYFHITSEWVSPAYMTLTLHKSLLTDKEYSALKQEFIDAIALTEIKSYRENGAMSDFIAGL